jgi:hypothetical protein
MGIIKYAFILNLLKKLWKIKKFATIMMGSSKAIGKTNRLMILNPLNLIKISKFPNNRIK